MTTHYNIQNDELYTNYLSSKPNLSELSKKSYETTLNKFCKGLNITLKELVDSCKDQQGKIIERTTFRGYDGKDEITEKTITKFDVNSPNALIKQYLNDYIDYCKSKGNKNITINNDIEIIKAFLIFSGVEIPKLRKLEDDTSKWYLLEKEDLNYILSDSSLVHSSLISFLIQSGMRIKDALSLTIGDFMTATSEYHDFVDVNDFIDNAPENMIGSWKFNPHKTKRFNVECQTFNGPESCNYILQNLRKIKNEYIPYAKRKYDLNIKMSKDDALFGSQKSNFKGHIPPKAIASRFWLKNKKLKEYRINKIKQDIKKGLLSEEDFDREVAKIPKFHAHGCRKYFETMIAKNCGDLRICTLLEGHVSPVATDSSYIKKDIEDVREAYMLALEDLSLENTEVKVYTSEIRREMEEKIASLENMNSDLQSEIDKMDEIMARLDKLENKS